METGTGNEPLIDPEVKAFVFSLVSALGGSSAGDDGRYVLGDDALAVLKDIKRWIRLYDDKLNRLDVARLLYDANLVKGDLLEILASWPEDAPEASFKAKTALLSVDLLMQLTWPIEHDVETATLARYLHIPTLKKAHAGYKAAILNHPNTAMLKTVARVCLPSLAESQKERTPYDDNVLKVVLYFFRNIAMITQPPDTAVDESESGIDRSATIDEFHYQDIFGLILAICSNMNDDYSKHDVELLDIVFHLVRGVDTENLFMEDQEMISANTRELQNLMGMEKGMHAIYARHAPSRHNRFGTMLWVGRDGGKRATLFGQKATGNEQLSMSEIDKSKKWRRPRRPVKKDTAQDQPTNTMDSTVKLTARARRHLRSFVEQFLDSSFNPLFHAVRRAIEREESRVVPQQHVRQYLYLISWFLKAEGVRRKRQAHERAKQLRSAQDENEVENFQVVATVLNQETFVLLNRHMQSSLDDKKWHDLNAAMKCFTQILLTVQMMSESPVPQDQEDAEIILSRIFYEQTTHDRIVALLRSYKDQGFGYLDACTELSHVFLRILERYSKQNVELQVRSRRRARKKKRVAQPSEDTDAEMEDRVQDAEDVANAQRTVTERKFDFKRFSAKFVNQSSVDTFVALLRYYQDLNDEQLKRAHRFFYRVAFKMEQTVYLFRMDIVQLLNKVVRGPEGLNNENPTYREWEELARQVFRRLVKRLEDRPALAVELLFSKIPSTMYYLEHGYDREVPKKTPRVAAELEVKPGMEKEDHVGVAVSILVNQSKSDALSWLKGVLTSAASERKAWEESNIAIENARRTEQTARWQQQSSVEGDERTNVVSTQEDQSTGDQSEPPKAPSIFVQPDNDERKKAMHQDKYLRLLLTTLSFDRLAFDSDVSETTWLIPSALSSSYLSSNAELIGKVEFNLPTFEEGKSAEEMVRRKQAPREPRPARVQEERQDSEGSSGTDIEETLLKAGNSALAANQNPQKKNRLLKRQRRSKDDIIDEAVLEARRKAKKKSEAEQNRRIKSDLFIRDSDDEDDEERDRLFFEREQALRDKVAAQGGNLGYMEKAKMPKKSKAKRKKSVELSSDSEEEAGPQEAPAAKKRKAPQRAILLSDEESEVDEMPVVSVGAASSSSAQNSGVDEENASSAETDTETPASSQRPSTSHSSVHKSGGRKIGDEGGDDVEKFAESGSDKENAPLPAKPAAAQARRSVRAGFIIDSDSDE